jgi:hypothetical protein
VKRMMSVGLGAVLVLMMTMAVGVASAAAMNFAADTYPATVRGQQQVGAPHVFHFDMTSTSSGNRSYVKCGTATLTGTLSAPSNDLSQVPSYSDCTTYYESGNTINTSISPNGCAYTFHVDSAGVDVDCPPDRAIVIQIATCKIEIFDQTGITEIEGEPYRIGGRFIGWDGIMAHWEDMVDVAYRRVDGFLCQFDTTADSTTGAFTGDTSMEGYNSGGSRQDFWVQFP